MFTAENIIRNTSINNRSKTFNPFDCSAAFIWVVCFYTIASHG